MKDFLNFAKPQKPLVEPVNLNQVLNTTLAFYLKSRPIGRTGGRRRSGSSRISARFPPCSRT